MADVQCKALIFGGSADNGYARLLEPYSGDRAMSSRIILLEGPSFAPELAKLRDKFSVAHFPALFRDTKLPSRRTSLSTTPPPLSTQAPSYASTVSSTLPLPAAQSDALATPMASHRDYPVLQNSHGHRLDALLSPHPHIVQVMRYQKMCNLYHILGKCPLRECKFDHGLRLNDAGIEARRLLGREKPCKEGLECNKRSCLRGHQCPDAACVRIGIDCQFPREMHNVDRT